MSDRTIKTVTLSHARLVEIAQPIVDVMNDSQKIRGATIDETLMAAAFALGVAMAQCGCALLENQPLKRAVPPLVSGYNYMYRHLKMNQVT